MSRPATGPTYLEAHAVEGSTYPITLNFRNHNGAPATPDSATWTLTDINGNVINGRLNEAIAPVSSQETIVLSGNDLALGANDTGQRLVVARAIYDSDLGNDLPLVDEIAFYIDRLVPSGFTYDLSTNVGQVRLEIGDDDNTEGVGVKPNGKNFSDAEISQVLAGEGSVLKAAARLCEILARRWAGAGENVRIRDYSINTTDKAKYYKELAAELRARTGSAFAGGSAATTRVDGYSNDISSEETPGAGSEYWTERPVIRWP